MDLKEQNKGANIHLLSNVDEIFFKHKIEELLIRIKAITNANELKGKWTVSQDFKWLVKVED